MNDSVSRRAAIEVICMECHGGICDEYPCGEIKALEHLPSAQPEPLTDDDFETIRIHLSAFKEELCNQHRWAEAEEYQRIIDRFMGFASSQPERRKGRWIKGVCECGYDWAKDAPISSVPNFCPNCGADMREGEVDEAD